MKSYQTGAYDREAWSVARNSKPIVVNCYCADVSSDDNAVALPAITALSEVRFLVIVLRIRNDVVSTKNAYGDRT